MRQRRHTWLVTRGWETLGFIPLSPPHPNHTLWSTPRLQCVCVCVSWVATLEWAKGQIQPRDTFCLGWKVRKFHIKTQTASFSLERSGNTIPRGYSWVAAAPLQWDTGFPTGPSPHPALVPGQESTAICHSLGWYLSPSSPWHLATDTIHLASQVTWICRPCCVTW